MAAFPTIIVVVQDVVDGLFELLAQVNRSGLPWVVACRSEVAPELRRDVGEDAIVSTGWGGQARSLISTAVLARPQSGGWLVLPARLVRVQSSTLCGVAKALNDFPLVYPQYNGLRGDPVGFGSEFFSELMSLGDDEREPRRLLARYAGCGIDVEDAGVLRRREDEVSSAASRGVQLFDSYQGK